ncbi:hypothetical protein ACMA1I_10185 [Pontibacter sp. 13R65]|uniref:hypothetical protein n=1 Tax=Pontibacter sp. 13R65 TaxID=3127458 RepID=UPI00301CD323
MDKLNHILLVSNDPIHTMFSQIILEDANASDLITVCESAPEALEFLDNFRAGLGTPFPDLILLDINLSGKEEFYFLEEYHMLNYHLTQPAIISIFATPNHIKQAEQACQYIAVAGFIPKPLSLTNLYKVLTVAFSYNLSKQF